MSIISKQLVRGVAQMSAIVNEIGQREWADIMVPCRIAEVCPAMPGKRLTPPQFREWIAEGAKRCRSREDAAMWNSYVIPLRQDYFAELPDCVFAAAVRKEADAAALREYRAFHAERKQQRALRLEIRQLEALKNECVRNPLYFDNAEEQEMELAQIEIELTELKQKCKPIVESKKNWSSIV